MKKYISEYLGILNGPEPPRPPLKNGGIAFRAKVAKANQVSQVDTGPYHGNGGRTNQREREDQRARQYWAAYRAGQEAKREAGMEYTPPGWLGARKRKPKRNWIPGEHKPVAPSSTLKEQTTPTMVTGVTPTNARKTEPGPGQGELF